MARQTTSTRRQRRLVVIAAAVFGIGPFVHPACAQTTTEWINTSGGDWTDPTSWSTNPVYPNGANYNALIDQAGTGPYSVNLEDNIAVGTLSLTTVNATLNQTAGTLTASTVNITGGTYQISGGTLTGSAAAESFQLTVGTGAGGLFENQGATLNNISTFGSGAFVNDGTVNSTLPNATTGYYVFLYGSTLTNNGVLQVDPGAKLQFGAMQNGYPPLLAGTNSAIGIINANDGLLLTAGNFTNAGVINLTNDASLDLAVNATTAGLGTINASSNSTITIGGTIDNTGSTLALGEWTLGPSGVILNGTLGPGSNVMTNGGVFNGVTVAAGAIIVGNGTFFEGSWSNQGTIQANSPSARFYLAGNFTTSAIGNISGSPTVYVVGSLDNSNSTLAAGSTTHPWYVGAVSTFSGLLVGTVTGGTIASGSFLLGTGGTLSGVTIASGANVGTSLNGGNTLFLTGPWTNNGAISVVSDSTLYISGISGSAGPSATLANAGTVNQSSGSASPGALSGTGALIVGNTGGGSTAAMTVPSLTQSSVTINATGSLAITGGSANGVNALVHCHAMVLG